MNTPPIDRSHASAYNRSHQSPSRNSVSRSKARSEEPSSSGGTDTRQERACSEPRSILHVPKQQSPDSPPGNIYKQSSIGFGSALRSELSSELQFALKSPSRESSPAFGSPSRSKFEELYGGFSSVLGDSGSLSLSSGFHPTPPSRQTAPAPSSPRHGTCREASLGRFESTLSGAPSSSLTPSSSQQAPSHVPKTKSKSKRAAQESEIFWDVRRTSSRQWQASYKIAGSAMVFGSFDTQKQAFQAIQESSEEIIARSRQSSTPDARGRLQAKGK